MALLEGPKEITVFASKTYLASLLVILTALMLSGCPSPDTSFGGSLNPPDPSAGGGGGDPSLIGELELQVGGGGTVTSEPDVVTCIGVDPANYCYVQIPIGTVVTLTAVPDGGFDFSRWVNCDGPVGLQCIFSMNTGVVVAANFVAQ